MRRPREPGEDDVAVKNDASLLKNVPLFEGLSGKDLKAIFNETREETFKAGTAIVTEGGVSGRFYLIIEGEAKVSAGGRTRRTLRAGEYFGELSLIDKGPRSATVTATSNVVARSLTSFSFLALVDEHASISRKVMQQLCRQIRANDKSPIS